MEGRGKMSIEYRVLRIEQSDASVYTSHACLHRARKVVARLHNFQRACLGLGLTLTQVHLKFSPTYYKHLS